MVRADIMQGHVLERLRELPDNSVDLCITSPPYWGLRCYNLPPLTWPAVEYAPMAGLPVVRIPGEMDCEHEWGNNIIAKQAGGGWAIPKDQSNYKQDAGKKDFQLGERSQGQFCQKCGAWRGSLGLEPTIEMFVGHLVLIFREVRRVMAKHAVCFVNLGDSYNGGNQSILKPKDLCGVPWRVALALQADGWWLRSDIIWAKNNCMPESVNDRPTRSHEYVFLLAKSAKYYWDAEAVKVEAIYEEKRNGRVGAYQNKAIYSKGDGTTPTGEALRDLSSRNLRTVWTIPSAPMSCGLCAKCGKYWHTGAPQQHCGQQTVGHFAAFPPKLVEPMIKAGSSQEGYCPKCGKPWGRVVEKSKISEPTEAMKRAGCSAQGEYHGQAQKNYQEALAQNPSDTKRRILESMSHESKTVDWQPACSCGLDPRPGVVLDIFGGALTTAMVAAKLGRDSISCELNPDYIRMGVNRLRAELGMLINVELK